MLYEESAIDPTVAAERGVRSVSRGRGELPGVFSWQQKRRAPGLLFTVHRPNGETATIFRPDSPDPKNPGRKYEQECKHLGGSGNVLDVHPRMRTLLDDPSIPLVFVEGIKKADAITSAAIREGIGIVAVGISGVWNWLSKGEPIPDMYEIPVEGRKALVCYDSDMFRNPGVQMAGEGLALHLKGRGAGVGIVYLPDQPDVSKTGADDFLAGGGGLGELLDLARPFDPEELQREKLTRSERLRRFLAFLARRSREMPTKTRRDCSKLATWRAHLTLAERRGKPVEGGVEVAVAALTGAEIAGVSQPTFSKYTRELEEDGYLRRIERKRSEQATSYVLIVGEAGGVSRYKNGEGGGTREGTREGQDSESHPGYNVIPPLAPLPELRWSKPGRKAKRGVVEGTRRVRQGRAFSGDSPPVRRPGKKRGEIVRYIRANGGTATRAGLLERFGGERTTWRDFKKQTLADLLGRRRRYRGQDLEVGPPIIELTDDGVRFVADWREALEKHRELGGEEEAAIQQMVDHLRQRAAYRKRHDNRPDRHPANHHADGWAEDLEPDPTVPTAPQPRPTTATLAEVVARPDLAPETPLPRSDPAQATAPVEGRDGPPPTPPWAGRLRDWMARYPYRAGVYGVGAGYANYLYRTLWAYWPDDDPAPPPAPDAVAAAIAAIRAGGGPHD